MHPDKHSKTIKLNNTTIHLDGVPDDCQHDWTGEPYYELTDGSIIHKDTFSQYRSFTQTARQALILLRLEQESKQIASSGVTCKKCGKFYTPDLNSILC